MRALRSREREKKREKKERERERERDRERKRKREKKGEREREKKKERERERARAVLRVNASVVTNFAFKPLYNEVEFLRTMQSDGKNARALNVGRVCRGCYRSYRWESRGSGCLSKKRFGLKSRFAGICCHEFTWIILSTISVRAEIWA